MRAYIAGAARSTRYSRRAAAVVACVWLLEPSATNLRLWNAHITEAAVDKGNQKVAQRANDMTIACGPYQELQNVGWINGGGEAFSKIWTCAADFRRVFETAARKQCDAKLMAFPELDVHRDRVTKHVPVAHSRRRVA